MNMGKSSGLKICPSCGNNPVPHFLYWYFESLNIFFAPVRRLLLHNTFSRLCRQIAGQVNLAWKLARLGKALGIIKFQGDIDLCKISRAKVLWEEASRRGINMQELLLFGKPFDVYTAEQIKDSRLKIKEENLGLKSEILNHKSILVFSGLPRPRDTDSQALEWMDDKWLFKKKLMEYNLPVAKGGVAGNFSQAKKLFYEIQTTHYSLPTTRLPVIVKPRAGSRGRHSTTFVLSMDDLRQAYKVAKQLCHWVIVEELLKGPVYRATLINYELCGVLRGDGPQVVGDGEHNLGQLIQIKNQMPHLGVKNMVIDDSMELFLARQNFQLSSIPKKDEVINLSEKIGVNYGGSSSEDFEVCHADNKELFIRAAKIIGDPIVGFDFIIPDITKSWKEQKCGFIEANSLPFINLHHDPFLGKPRNVAVKVWEMMKM